MDLTLGLIIGVVVVALIFDYTNGFHDAANAIATSVSAPRWPRRWAKASSTRLRALMAW